MNVSVVVTTYNEAGTIETLLDTLAAQTRQPDEIVICDGGSSDDTVRRIERRMSQRNGCLPVRLIVEPGANISRGRNIAIDAACGPIIAVTDAGTRLSANWLAELVAPWQQTRDAKSPIPVAVAGFFLPEAHSWFETAMAATVLPLVEDIRPDRFLPSSRSVAFLKEAWQQAGQYPEWLDYCEDLIFDLQINGLCAERPSAFIWAPHAVVFFRPRGDLWSFWQQYYRYSRGDGKADLWRKRHAIRYFVYLIAAPVLTWLGFHGLRYGKLGWLALGIGTGLYCSRPWQRLRQLWSKQTGFQRMLAIGAVPVIRVVGDVAKMFGYPVGLWWRWNNRQRREIFWRTAADRQGSDGATAD